MGSHSAPVILANRRYNPRAKLWGPLWFTGMAPRPVFDDKATKISLAAENACMGEDAPVGELSFADPALTPEDGDMVTLRTTGGTFISKIFYRVRCRDPQGGASDVDVPFLTCHWATLPLCAFKFDAMAVEVLRVRFPGKPCVLPRVQYFDEQDEARERREWNITTHWVIGEILRRLETQGSGRK